MLLGAAKHLAATRNFKGSVALIFQPAEASSGHSLSWLFRLWCHENLDPTEALVVSVPKFTGSESYHIIPDTVTLGSPMTRREL